MDKTLSAFLAQNAQKIENQKVVASSRFRDENGNPIAWEITCISAAENQKLRKACIRQIPASGKRGQYVQETDMAAYQAKLAARCTVFPDLNDADLQESYGVMGAEALISAMLSPGEFDNYFLAITELCGFKSEDELVAEAKN